MKAQAGLKQKSQQWEKSRVGITLSRWDQEKEKV